MSRGPIGYKQSAEHTQKSADARRGAKRTPEMRARMSAGKKGRPSSELNRINSAAARVGLKRSDETRRRMSEAQRGKKHTPETLAKMSAARLGKPNHKNAGPNHYNWKGGDSRQRYPTEYMAWARAVKRRDDFVCQRCGHQQRRGMHAHHLKAWADFPELRYDIENGVTLCPPCHRNTGLHVGVSRTKRHDPAALRLTSESGRC